MSEFDVRAATWLLREMTVQFEASRTWAADGFVIEILDPETDETALHGPFTTAPEAAAWAESHIARFTELGDDGVALQATIRPIYAPERG